MSLDYCRERSDLANQIFFQGTTRPLEEFGSLEDITRKLLIAALLLAEHDEVSINKKIELLDKLLGQDEDIVNEYFFNNLGTPLTLAIESNEPQLVRFLIEKKNASVAIEQDILFAVNRIKDYSSCGSSEVVDSLDEALALEAKTKEIEKAKNNFFKILTYLIRKSSSFLESLKKINLFDLSSHDQEKNEILYRMLISDLDSVEENDQKWYNEEIRTLFTKKVNVKRTDGLTLLDMAIKYGQIFTVIYLFTREYYDHRTHQNENGDTPFHVAAQYGQVEVLEYLLAQGYNIENKNKYYYTAFHVAAQYGQVEVVKFLVTKKANCNSPAADDRVFEYVETYRNFSQMDSYNNSYTPIYVAVQYGQLKIAEYLFNLGSVLKKLKNGDTPFHIAAQYGQVEILAYFSKRYLPTDENEQGETLFHKAAQYNQVKVLEYFVAKGDILNAQDKEGNTLLHIAAQYGKSEVVEYLIAQNRDGLDKRNNKGETALYVAAVNKRELTCKALIGAGANSNIPDLDGCTPFQEITRRQRLGVYSSRVIIKILQEEQAKLDSKKRSPNDEVFSHLKPADTVGFKPAVKNEPTPLDTRVSKFSCETSNTNSYTRDQRNSQFKPAVKNEPTPLNTRVSKSLYETSNTNSYKSMEQGKSQFKPTVQQGRVRKLITFLTRTILKFTFRLVEFTIDYLLKSLYKSKTQFSKTLDKFQHNIRGVFRSANKKESNR